MKKTRKISELVQIKESGGRWYIQVEGQYVENRRLRASIILDGDFSKIDAHNRAVEVAKLLMPNDYVIEMKRAK